MKQYVKLLERKRIRSDTRDVIQPVSAGVSRITARQHRFVGPQKRGGNVASLLVLQPAVVAGPADRGKQRAARHSSRGSSAQDAGGMA
jgi:hypothetical protein